MAQKDSLFVIIAAVFILAALAVSVYLPIQAAGHVREETIGLYGNHLEVLATRAALLIRRSDTASLSALLEGYTAGEGAVRYAYVQSAGRPYVDTFGGSFPQSLIGLHEELDVEPVAVRVRLPDGTDCYDFAMLLGMGNASIHLGVAAEHIDGYGLMSTVLPFALIGIGLLGGALYAVVVFAGAVRRFAATRKPREKPADSAAQKPASSSGSNWSSFLEALPTGAMLVDAAADIIVYVNRAAAAAAGTVPGSMRGQRLDSYLGSTEDRDLPLTDMDDAGDGKRAFIKTAGGGLTPVLRLQTTISLEGKPHNLILLTDVSDLKDLEERLRQAYQQQESLANYDKLTRLFNRRAIQKHAEAELNRAERGSMLSLLMFDIDHFKKVNDTHGHAAGDQVLKQMAYLSRHTLRPYDWLGRWGGEEFLIVLPGTPAEGAIIVAERLRKAVEENRIHLKGYQELQVTISIGLTSTEAEFGNSYTLDTLTGQADQALYHAKESGRNCVVLFRRDKLEVVRS
jgi:diguanylate cyclase (GGDEF)-like protein